MVSVVLVDSVVYANFTKACLNAPFGIALHTKQPIYNNATSWTVAIKTIESLSRGN